MVAISAPTIEKITTTIAAKIAPDAEREEAAVRGEVAEVQLLFGQRPSTNSDAEHQEDDDGRDFDAGEPELELAERARPRTGWCASSASIRISESSHSGASIQYWITFAPATASKPTTITQKYQ